MQWCYSEGNDLYVKVGEGYKFYGKLDGKVVIFVLLFELVVEVLDEEYDLWFFIGCVLEYWYIGSMICCVLELYCVFLEVVLFIYLLDVKVCDLCCGDKVKVVFCCGEVILIVEMCGCNCLLQGLVYMLFFDVVQLVNKLMLDVIDLFLKEMDFKKCVVKLEKV